MLYELNIAFDLFNSRVLGGILLPMIQQLVDSIKLN